MHLNENLMLFQERLALTSLNALVVDENNVKAEQSSGVESGDDLVCDEVWH